MSRQLHLVPALCGYEEALELYNLGEIMSFAVSPRSNSMAVFATPLHSFLTGGPSEDDPEKQDIYIACWNAPPSEERRTFVSDTSVVFDVVRRHGEKYRNQGQDIMRSPNSLSHFRKFAGDYIMHLQDCWVHASQMTGSERSPQFPGEHYKSLYTSFSLFQTLYLPEDGIEDVAVGDELLEWLNTHFIEPTTEEADQLSGLERPWEDETFWSYIIRATLRGLLKSSIFFLSCLSNHPSSSLQLLAEKLVDLLNYHPRLKNFNTEKEFSVSSRRWRERAKALRIDLDRVPEDDRDDGFENWWDNVSDLLGILEGRSDILQRVCMDIGGGWKEYICAYGVWVDVSMRRSDLPDIVGKILAKFPADPTDKEDILHAELAMGRTNQALVAANELDPWLSAHLADIMDPLGLLDSIPNEETGVSSRDQYVLSYANYLYSDPGMWRLTVSYLYTCGSVGAEMADEVLLRVPLSKNSARESGNEPDSEEDNDIWTTFGELNKVCGEHQREQTRRLICRIAAKGLVKLRKYDLAVSCCTSAEDWTGLGHIVDNILEEYIAHGPEFYIDLVSYIAPLLPELRMASAGHGLFIHRIAFAIRYAEFRQRELHGDLKNAAMDLVSMFEEELAPRSWWGVLLYDSTRFLQDERVLFFTKDATCLLLNVLDEINLRTKQGFGNDYLNVLARVLKLEGPKEALIRLDPLKLALARHRAEVARQRVDCNNRKCAVSQLHGRQDHNCANDCQQEYVLLTLHRIPFNNTGSVSSLRADLSSKIGPEDARNAHNGCDIRLLPLSVSDLETSFDFLDLDINP
ncbi:hypothetical protein PNOK_0450700 [Pyrrhoderma noxium]|uniref:Nuclear pore complex protein Nup85 n=1 Tax=Pyrrhoderma noxium TaxID=2282107 RepID=A0A286UIX3_9AGAM|nr:hypothetical protein PNOK_0450700 [Pyrrhoderma noxium]